MDSIVEKYYAQVGVPPFILKQKIAKFSRNPDLEKEFIFWIDNHSFMYNQVSIAGYTAEKLANMSEFLNGEAAFLLMVELRENPEKSFATNSRRFYNEVKTVTAFHTYNKRKGAAICSLLLLQQYC